VKWEEELQAHKDNTYVLIDEYIEEGINNSNVYESTHENDYDYWTCEHNADASISINKTFYSKCMNLLFLTESYHLGIMDGVTDTCLLGKGWEVLSIYSSRGADVLIFYHETAIKRNLPIVSGITILDLPNGQSVLLITHEIIYNETSNQ
jgi:hypothetical protein